MGKIDFKKDKIPFTQVANDVLNDKRLSAKAKGLYAYLYSKPQGWDFAIDRIEKDFQDGRKSINAGLQELEKEGYLLRERQATGKVIYLLKSQMTKTDIRLYEPDVPNGKEPKRQRAEKGTVSNKEKEVIKKNSNKEPEENKFSQEGAELVQLFEVINPACKRMYGNTTQRQACDDLIQAYGFDRVKVVIEKTLPMTNKMTALFFPNISTPLQLFQKWQKLEDAIFAYREKRITKTNNIAFS